METWIPGLSKAVDRLAETALVFLPRVAAALLLLFVGWVIARLLRSWLFGCCRGWGAGGRWIGI